LQDASEALRGDREVVMAAVKENGFALEFASEALRNDKKVVIAAVGYKGTCLRHGRALKYASEELRNDIDVVRAALSQSWDAVNYASRQIQRNIIQDWLGIKEVKND
jgi:hypothetical protein